MLIEDEFNIFAVRFFRKGGDPFHTFVGVTIPIIPGTDSKRLINEEIERLEQSRTGDRTKVNRNIAILKHCLEILEIETFYQELKKLDI